MDQESARTGTLGAVWGGEPSARTGVTLPSEGMDGAGARSAGRMPPDGEPGPWLCQLAQAMQLSSIAWLQPGRDPVAGGEDRGRRVQVQGVDWQRLSELPPGTVARITSDERRRSARLCAGEGTELWVRPSSDAKIQGVLRLVTPRMIQLPRARLMDLADAVAASFAAREERMAAERAERERRLGRMVAALGHDLRNQLNLATLQLDRLQELGRTEFEVGGVPAGAIDELVGVLAQARELCAGTVVGEPTLQRQRTPLRPLLLAEARVAVPLARGDRDVGVRVHCPASLEVHGHPAPLARLVRNLLLNAVGASVDGGEVLLRAWLEGPQAVLEVADSGCGMDREAQARFLQAGVSGNGGTGYGSASLEECLGQLGGALDLESQPGTGTRVRVRIPAAPPAGQPLILLVDGDALRLGRCQEALAAEGVAFLSAATLAEAQALVRDRQVRAVLMARGCAGAGLEPLLATARMGGLPVRFLGVGEADPLEAVRALGFDVPLA